MKLDKLEEAFFSEVVKILTVGYEYVDSNGYISTREPQLKPHLNSWISQNQQKIVTEIVKRVGEKEIVSIIADEVIAKLTTNNGYSKNYEAEALYKAVAPLVADAMAEKLTQRHKEEMCKDG